MRRATQRVRMWSLSFDEDGVCAFPAQTMAITHILLGHFAFVRSNGYLCRKTKAARTNIRKMAGLYSNPLRNACIGDLIGLDHLLFRKYPAGEVVGERDLDGQRLIEALDYAGHVEGEPIIDGYQGGKPELF